MDLKATAAGSPCDGAGGRAQDRTSATKRRGLHRHYRHGRWVPAKWHGVASSNGRRLGIRAVGIPAAARGRRNREERRPEGWPSKCRAESATRQRDIEARPPGHLTRKRQGTAQASAPVKKRRPDGQCRPCHHVPRVPGTNAAEPT
jgi:hypothetical protein